MNWHKNLNKMEKKIIRTMEEWKDRCSCCGKTGDPMFARIFYKKIKDKWQWLCSICWVEN